MTSPAIDPVRLLWDTYHHRVYAMAMHLVGNQDDAEELVQRTFIKAWENFAAFRGEADAGSWLIRITVRLALRERETSTRRTRLWLEAGHEPGEPTTKEFDPGNTLDIQRALDRVPRRARAVLVLYEIYGYSHDEIAAITGVSSGTSKSQLHRARQLLMEAGNE